MQLDLSTLSGPELRRMLDSARSRGQAAQSYQILQEMERRRREAPPRRRRARRRDDEPRIISIDLGDPLERKDDPFEIPEPPRAVEPEAEPLLFGAPEPEPAEPPEPEPAPVLTLAREPEPGPPRRRAGAGLVVFAAGAAAGVAVGVWLGPQARALLAPLATSPAAVTAAAPAPALPAATAPAPAEPAVAAAAPEPPVPDRLEIALASPSAVDAAEDASAPVAAPVAAPPTEPAPAAEPPAGDCASAATPADRTICGNAELEALQRRLRQAYAEALDAHQDRGLLRQRQLAWADARAGVTDPQRLASLYEARIRKLAAATADARRR